MTGLLDEVRSAVDEVVEELPNLSRPVLERFVLALRAQWREDIMTHEEAVNYVRAQARARVNLP